MHGRGIRIQNNGNIYIGYFNTGKVLGNFVQIDWDGEIQVGEQHRNADGMVHYQGIKYHADGTQVKFR